jgi:hypothetical protein
MAIQHEKRELRMNMRVGEKKILETSEGNFISEGERTSLFL